MESIKSFLHLAEYVLAQAKTSLTVNEIWSEAEMYIGKNIISFQTTGKTPAATLSSVLHMNVKKQASKFEKASVKPTKFALKNYNIDEVNANHVEDIVLIDVTIQKATRKNERDLHQYLAQWNFDNNDINCKTIKHETSTKNKVKHGELKDQWLYPDIIGVKFSFDYEKEVTKFAKGLSIPVVQLFSYEMKQEITNSNLREVYFQAVSNSSWAHEGYLVTPKLSGDNSLLSELSRLNNMFGIGVILLNTGDVNESEILLPAKNRDVLDMDILNHIAKKNADVKNLLTKITQIVDMSDKESRDSVIEKSFDKVIKSQEE